ncbi:MAG TPA: outer membrane beta-barrel protein [Bacteroidia bacterium]|jgi:hypothetical protein
MKKNLFSTLAVITFSTAFSQTTPVTTLVKDGEISVVAGMTAAKFKNSTIEKDEHVTLEKQNGFDFSFEYSKYVANRIGFGIGVGASTYKQEYFERGLFILSNQVDKDGTTYDRWVKSDISYTDKLTYLNIPISMHLLLGKSPRYYGFIDAGIINGFLISQLHTESGSKEAMSRYPTQYNNLFILSQNDPNYGDITTAVSKKDEERYKFYNMSVHLAVGIAASMTDRLFLKVKPFLNYGFSDITGPDNKDKDYENILGQTSKYTKTSLFSAGIDIGFAFNL